MYAACLCVLVLLYIMFKIYNTYLAARLRKSVTTGAAVRI